MGVREWVRRNIDAGVFRAAVARLLKGVTEGLFAIAATAWLWLLGAVLGAVVPAVTLSLPIGAGEVTVQVGRPLDTALLVGALVAYREYTQDLRCTLLE